MDQDLIEPVLQEILEELKQTNMLNRENTRALMEQDKRLSTIERKLNDGVPATNNENSAVFKSLAEHREHIIKAITDRPTTVTQNKRILLFPEHNAAEFYKVFYGRLIKWFAIILISCFMYGLGKMYITAWSERNWYRDAYTQLIKEKEENTRKIKAKVRNSTGNSH